MSVQVLNALTIPLTGIRLIEASAGTGKTYTIANLYLRSLLGIGLPQPLSVERILVVTFTTAATEELRDRVRRRIVDALADFATGESSDPFIDSLIAQFPESRTACILLDAAQRQMDDAAIYTIHGFCHRALADNAFESGMGFDLEMVIDETVLLQRAIEDFWRQHIATLDADAASLLPATWRAPSDVLQSIKPYLGSQQLSLEPVPDWSPSRGADLRAAVDQFKREWLDDAIAELLSNTNFKGRSKPGSRERIQAMQEYCGSTALEFRYARDESWNLWTPESLDRAMPKGQLAPVHGIFARCAQLDEAFASARENLRIYLICRGIEELGASMRATKRELGQLSPDDLLLNLGEALDRPRSGARLAQLLAQRYPLIMVDEFQDTDSVQYRIFSSIFADSQDCGWIMIGDPKQAIYKFRGADVFTYMAARRRVAQQPMGLLTLKTNWRSSSAMITAVNALFSYAEQANTNGAFLYPEDIPFVPVDASPTADELQLLCAGKPLVPMTFLYCRGAGAKGQLSGARAREFLAQKTAMQLVSLLNQSTDKQLLIGDKPLAPGNIAVLVRDRNEAAAVKSALAMLGVNSVFLSRESVFDAPVATDLYHVLQAVMHPVDERKLRSALATELLGASLPEIAGLDEDVAAMQVLLDEFAGYHEQLQRYGVLSMLRQMMSRRDIPAQLLARADGQRRLTDLRHLGELLQQAGETSSGLHDLLRWYQRHLLGEMRQDSDSQRVRLESDSQLVQIVTIHASKGLEFDVVFIPLASVARSNAQCIFHRQDALSGGESFITVADLSSTEESQEATEHERLAEDMRLLYVALTRARHKCYVGMANTSRQKPSLPFADSAIAHLLGLGGSELDETTLLERLEETVVGLGSGAVALETFSATDLQAREYVRWPATTEPALARPRTPALARDDWHLTSYTALARSNASPVLLGGANDEQEAVALVDADDERCDAFTFPRGARYGTLLHNILEQIDFSCEAQALGKVVERQLASFGLDAGKWTGAVAHWLEQVLASALLPIANLTLHCLPAAVRISEMEFNFSLDKTVSAAGLDRLLRRHTYLQNTAPLAFADVSGIMRGFIDLVFEYEGRFYVLDYKSNYLGGDVASYRQAQMAEAISGHRYDLQYLIYCTALHRYLSTRLQDYVYETHFGGVYYLFLRGMGAGAKQGEGVYFHRPKQRVIEDLDAFFRGESA
jgi:exodeoxyribonuclease V beta subunit